MTGPKRQYTFVLRTIKGGKVTIFGKTYAPDERHLKYDGRLDNLRYWFGRYPSHLAEEGYKPFVCLWGRKEQLTDSTVTYGPECVDGTLPWYWWNEVKLCQS